MVRTRTRPRPRPCRSSRSSRSRLACWRHGEVCCVWQSRKFLFVIIYFGVSNKHHTSSVHETCFICDFPGSGGGFYVLWLRTFFSGSSHLAFYFLGLGISMCLKDCMAREAEERVARPGGGRAGACVTRLRLICMSCRRLLVENFLRCRLACLEPACLTGDGGGRSLKPKNQHWFKSLTKTIKSS